MKSILKGELVKAAFSRARVSGLTLKPSNDELDLALDRLEDMMAEWQERNVCLGYFFEDEPNPNTPHNVPRAFHRAIKSNLAMGILADFNKLAPPSLIAEAQGSLSALYSSLARTKQISYPARMPIGSGNTLRDGRWDQFYRPEVTIDIECDHVLYVDDVQDFTQSFTDFMRQDETLTSHTITVDEGVTVVSSSLSSPDVKYRVQADTEGVFSGTITVVSSLGRQKSAAITFEVKGLD